MKKIILLYSLEFLWTGLIFFIGYRIVMPILSSRDDQDFDEGDD